MKAIVVKDFIDKYSKTLYKKGLTIDVSESRFEEMNSTKHGAFVEEVKEEPPNDPPEESEIPPEPPEEPKEAPKKGEKKSKK